MLLPGEWENRGQLSLQVSLGHRDLTPDNCGILGGFVSARNGKNIVSIWLVSVSPADSPALRLGLH